jgi:hypothetical protein
VPAAPVTCAELGAALDAIGNIYKKHYRLRHPVNRWARHAADITRMDPDGSRCSSAWTPNGFVPHDDLSFEPAAALW